MTDSNSGASDDPKAMAPSWLKLPNDGDRAVITVVGDAHRFKVCFVNGESVPATDALIAAGQRVSERVAINVVDLGDAKVKILELPARAYDQLLRVARAFGATRFAIRVTRTGVGLETRYVFVPARPLTAAQTEEYAQRPRHDLAAVYAGDRRGGARAAAGGGPGRVDGPTARAIVENLRALPAAATDRFLAHFGIARVADLPVAQGDAAFDLLAELHDQPASG